MPVEIAEKSAAVDKERVTTKKDEVTKALEELLTASKHDSGVSLEYFKGMVYGVVKSLLKG